MYLVIETIRVLTVFAKRMPDDIEESNYLDLIDYLSSVDDSFSQFQDYNEYDALEEEEDHSVEIMVFKKWVRYFWYLKSTNVPITSRCYSRKPKNMTSACWYSIDIYDRYYAPDFSELMNADQICYDHMIEKCEICNTYYTSNKLFYLLIVYPDDWHKGNKKATSSVCVVKKYKNHPMFDQNVLNSIILPMM
jgi:hypothetical protein